MAERVQVRGTDVKIRNPFLVFVWSLVTLGIYYVVWYYKVNRELRDAAGVNVSPVVALLAITVGWIVIVPPFVSWYRTFARTAEAQRSAGLAQRGEPDSWLHPLCDRRVLPSHRSHLRAGRVEQALAAPRNARIATGRKASAVVGVQRRH